MDMLSPRFLFNAVLDEIAEKRGAYWKDPDLHRTHFFDECALALSTDGFGGVPYVMWGRPDLWRPESYGADVARVYWVRVDSLADFVQIILPRLKAPIVLVTGASDNSPLRYAPEASAAILASDLISHWFCGQSDFPILPAKVIPVPLGLPYPYRNDVHFAKPWYNLSRHITKRYDIARYDKALAGIVKSRKPFYQRKPLAYCDFALNNTSHQRYHGETRAEVAAILRGTGCCHFPDGPVQPMKLYETYRQYAFVVSPFGRAMDCYRTWEALVMGAIPIVRRSPLEPMFEGLPVAIVDDWSEVTAARLAEWSLQFRGAWDEKTVEKRLTLDHWVKRIRAAAGRP